MVHEGCCGMGGEFGYRHPIVSKKIAQNSLKDAISRIEDGDLLIVTGSGCRRQILDTFRLQSTHLPSLFLRSLECANVK